MPPEDWGLPHGRVEVKPQDYSARTEYRPPAGWYRRLNWLGVLLTSVGLAPRDAVALQVRGRTSGKLRRVPILRTRYQGKNYLVALAGESQWVRNVRAARGDAVIRRGRARHVRLEELAPADRPDIIAEYLRAGRRRSGADANADQARFYFGLGPDPSIDDIRANRRPLPRVPSDLHKLDRIKWSMRGGERIWRRSRARPLSLDRSRTFSTSLLTSATSRSTTHAWFGSTR
ncbi:nitroreductase/quinone reductase family protein [Micromonospora sp. NBC_00898]|uniref:nitroreductase/quinone reductase family protein n=1 Tax=Micromonospora sp. NBC_00898 TaxID=2975981 RepID=UPI00386915F8